MDDMNALLKDAERLETLLRPTVTHPVTDLSDGGALKVSDPIGTYLDEARTVLRHLLPHYERATASERTKLREVLRRYPSFAWAAVPAAPIRTAEDLRVHLLAFSLLDQRGDPRDEFGHLVAICRQAQAAKLPVRRTLFRVARLSSMKNRGVGSTWTLMWWAMLWPFRYGGPEHDRYLRAE